MTGLPRPAGSCSAAASVIESSSPAAWRRRPRRSASRATPCATHRRRSPRPRQAPRRPLRRKGNPWRRGRKPGREIPHGRQRSVDGLFGRASSMGGVADFDFLANHAESLPSKPAVILGGQTLDFATLNRRANRAANVFNSLGCEAGDRVALMSFNSIAGFEIANGVRRSGTGVPPVNYRLRGPEMAYPPNGSGARVDVAVPLRVVPSVSAQPPVNSTDPSLH